jgi:hypothetical protein
MVPVSDLSWHSVPAEYNLDDPYIAGLVRAYRGETTPAPPPISIGHASSPSVTVLLDGSHRLAAARLAGVTAIAARVESIAPKVSVASDLRRLAAEAVEAATRAKEKAKATPRRQRVEERAPALWDDVDLRTPGVRMVPLDALERCLTRVNRPGMVEHAIDGYRTGAAMPPITMRGGYLVDGNHRLTAARALRLDEIEVEFRPEPPTPPPTPARLPGSSERPKASRLRYRGGGPA